MYSEAATPRKLVLCLMWLLRMSCDEWEAEVRSRTKLQGRDEVWGRAIFVWSRVPKRLLPSPFVFLRQQHNNVRLAKVGGVPGTNNTWRSAPSCRATREAVAWLGSMSTMSYLALRQNKDEATRRMHEMGHNIHMHRKKRPKKPRASHECVIGARDVGRPKRPAGSTSIA